MTVESTQRDRKQVDDVYSVQTSVVAVSTCELVLTVRLTNADLLSDKSTAGAGHTSVLLIGDDDNSIVFKAKVRSVYTGWAKRNGATLISLKKLSQKLTDFSNFWYTETRRNVTS